MIEPTIHYKELQPATTTTEIALGHEHDNKDGQEEKGTIRVEKGGTEEKEPADRRSDIWIEKQEQIKEGAELCQVGHE